MKIVTAIVLDGFHKGHTVRIEYHPIIRLLKPTIMRIDYCCDGDSLKESEPEIVEYKEVFRAVDKDMILYSMSGKSLDLIGGLPWKKTTSPWTEKTELYFGYHGEPVLRNDNGEIAEN